MKIIEMELKCHNFGFGTCRHIDPAVSQGRKFCPTKEDWEKCDWGSGYKAPPTDELEDLVEKCISAGLGKATTLYAIKLLAERVIACEANDKITAEILAGHANSINNTESRLKKLEVENAEYPMSKQAMNPLTGEEILFLIKQIVDLNNLYDDFEQRLKSKLESYLKD